MRLIDIRGRCAATTKKGRRCQMAAEPELTKCRYHCGGPRTEAQHAKNRANTKAYWSRRRAEQYPTGDMATLCEALLRDASAAAVDSNRAR
jgi:hypothetical protein